MALVARDNVIDDKDFEGARSAADEIAWLADGLRDSIDDCKSIATYGPKGPTFDDLVKLLKIDVQRS
jgi:hypothetical protein